MQKITPFLWFDGQAEDAVNFYTSLFKNSKIGRILRYTKEAAENSGRPVGSVLTIEFEIEGQKFVALNGVPLFKFNESISFVINCETQEEVDYFWGKLTADGGEESQCGWVNDEFGLSWQVWPAALGDMMAQGTPEQVRRVTQAFLPMKKFDIARLWTAYREK